MVVLLLVAGIGFLLAGLVAIGFGIPINEFGFGNTLIVAGTVAACTGMLLIGLWTAVKELKNIARRLGPGAAAESHAEIPSQSAPAPAGPRNLFSRDQPGSEDAGDAEPSASAAAPSPPPWHGEAAPRDRAQDDGALASAADEVAPAVKPRRNLLFSSSSRKERERAQARTTDPAAAEPDLRPAPAVAPTVSEPNEPPPASFDDAWPKSERARTADPLPRRSVRAPSTFTESNSGDAGADRQPPAARSEEPPPV